MTVSQDSFVAALLAPDQPVPEGLSDPEGRPAGKRFDVYRNNVAVSLTDALETAFPVVAKLLGEVNFRNIAGVYLRRHPPRSPLMMFYGAEMPAFLAGFPPVAHLGYLPDIARLELALREAYHAADATAIDPARLGALPPDRLMASRVRLAPAVRLIRSPWPVHAIWRFNMEEGTPKPAMMAEDVLVVRPEFDPEPLLLPVGGGAFVAALADGRPFSDAFDAGAAEVPEFDLAATLGLLLTHGALTELDETP